jgi:hypothetical protein
MNEYVVSESFDMSNKEAWILSGKAESAEEFVMNKMIDGYEMYVSPAVDIAIVKYPEKTYMVFGI